MKADKPCAHIVCIGREWMKMDCFKAALEYLMRAALENLGLTGEVIVTKIEPEEQKEEKAG